MTRSAQLCAVPEVPSGLTSVWAQYTVRVPAAKRAAILDSLKADGIPTAMYYPKPLHQNGPYRRYPFAANGLPVTEAICHEVFSLPMHGYLDIETQDRIIVRGRKGHQICLRPPHFPKWCRNRHPAITTE